MSRATLGPVSRTFRAVVATVVPEAAALDEDQWRRVEAAVERALALRPEQVRRQIALFLRVLGWMPVARWGRRFPALSPERRRRTLAALERAPALLLRRGLWGVRTLAFLGYYGLDEVRSGIGYRAHPDGWEARERVRSPEDGDRSPQGGGRPPGGPSGGGDDGSSTERDP